MKIELEIPDWASGGFLRIIHNNMETVAFKDHGADSPWMVKSSRCNNCGECCLDVHGLMPSDDEGRCIYLVKEGGKYRCNAGGSKNAGCFGDPDIDGCTVIYRKQ